MGKSYKNFFWFLSSFFFSFSNTVGILIIQPPTPPGEAEGWEGLLSRDQCSQFSSANNTQHNVGRNEWKLYLSIMNMHTSNWLAPELPGHGGPALPTVHCPTAHFRTSYSPFLKSWKSPLRIPGFESAILEFLYVLRLVVKVSCYVKLVKFAAQKQDVHNRRVYILYTKM